jgi:hypothetical protein
VPTFTTVRPINHLACGACQYESVRLSFPPSLDGARPSVVRPRWATTTHRTARHGTARHGAPRCQPCQCTPTNYSISGRALNIASGNGVTSGATASCCTLCDLLARTASTGHRAPNHDPGWTTLIATHACMHVRARGCLLGKKNCSYRHYIVDRLNHSVCPFAALPLSASVTL